MFPFLAAVFLGAYLLFLVQPLMGRFVLPWQGGAPAVWTACLLFFQTALLLGYFYAHLLGKQANLRRQIGIHLGLLAGALIWMPPLPALSTSTAGASLPPVVQVLLMLSRTIGPPFVLLAGSSPLLQRWFTGAHPNRSPYRLYALSNAGSLLALLSYPLLLEPWLTRGRQAGLWAALFVAFVGTVVWVAVRVRRVTPVHTPRTVEAAAKTPAPTAWQRLSWITWAAIATALLAATTSALTLDVAAVPFLWIAPLGLYLLSLIFCFDHPRWYLRRLFVLLLPIAMAASIDLRIFGSTVTLTQLLSTHLLALGVALMLCHGELVRTKPAPAYLTSFYLSLAAGGVLGTLVTAVLSPRLFDHDNDLPLLWTLLVIRLVASLIRRRDLQLARLWSAGLLIALLAVPALRPSEYPGALPLVHTWLELARHTVPHLTVMVAALLVAHLHSNGRLLARWLPRTGWGLAVLVAVMAWFVVGTTLQPAPGTVASRRGFFGEITVIDYNATDPRSHARYLAHGSTTHGIELLHPDYVSYPTSYYSANSGIGRAFSRANQHPGRRIGVIGLGVGTVASYGMSGDHLTFYEIDPNVIEMAQTYFQFLAKTPAQVRIRRGDGRRLIVAEVALGQEPGYDILVIDAFSSDSVPIHLLTREAMAGYLARLAPHGLLIVNVSNRLVDLRPVLEGHAHALGLHFAHLINRPDTDNWWDFSSEWILLATERSSLLDPTITSWTGIAAPEELEGITWTDDFASLWSVLR